MEVAMNVIGLGTAKVLKATGYVGEWPQLVWLWWPDKPGIKPLVSYESSGLSRIWSKEYGNRWGYAEYAAAPDHLAALMWLEQDRKVAWERRVGGRWWAAWGIRQPQSVSAYDPDGLIQEICELLLATQTQPVLT